MDKIKKACKLACANHEVGVASWLAGAKKLPDFKIDGIFKNEDNYIVKILDRNGIEDNSRIFCADNATEPIYDDEEISFDELENIEVPAEYVGWIPFGKLEYGKDYILNPEIIKKS